MRRTLLLCLVVALASPAAASLGQMHAASLPLDVVPDVHASGVVSSTYLDRDRNRILDELDALLPLLAPGERTTVIVLFTRPVTEEDVRADRLRHGDFPLNAIWTLVSGYSANLTAEQVLSFAARDDVLHLENERLYEAALSTARPSFGVDKAVADFGVTGDRYLGNKVFSTSDVYICTADTGIAASHVDLDQGQVRAWRDFVNGGTSPYDDHVHGTHVAGILAGQGDGVWANRGVAYGASLAVAKVLNAAGSGWTTNIISGINWCADLGVRIVSLSLGSQGSSDGRDSLSLAVDALADRGIVPVVAAGNWGPRTSTIGSPAAAENAITVCAMADTGVEKRGFHLAPWSSRGPTLDGRVKPDICGPGAYVTSVGAGGGYIVSNGTSMAAPFVAGVVALMIDAMPSLTVQNVKDCLYGRAQDWSVAGKDIDTGHGRLRAYHAITCAAGLSGNAPQPKHLRFIDSLSPTAPSDTWYFDVDNLYYPLALTLLGSDPAAGKDFDLYLYGPDGRLLYADTGDVRQDTAHVMPPVKGTYHAAVIATAGSGAYTLDISNGFVLSAGPPLG